MIRTPTVTIYNPISNNNQAYDFNASADCSITSVGGITTKGYTLITMSPVGGSVGDKIGWHWLSSAEL